MFTRPDVIGYVEQVLENIEATKAALSARDRFNLDRLQKEYTLPEARSDPKSRFDPPAVWASDTPLYLEGDLAVSLAPVKPLYDTRWAFFLTGNPDLRLHFKEWLTFEVRYQLAFGPERDDRTDKKKSTRRTKSWKGLTALYERAYLAYQWKRRVTLFWGRDYSNWGPSEAGNLILSDTAGSLDKWGGRITFKNLMLSFLNATLSAPSDRRFAGHRLEARFGPTVLGLTEAVIYAGRGFDPIYLMPLSSFYSNQFNERQDRDNITWELDLKYEATKGLLVYGSFLIDDYQFEDDPYPDKLAFDVGGRVALADPLPATFRFQYRYIDIYTYTHEDSVNYWVTGEGDLSLDNPLGAALGPDSDRAYIDMAVYPIPSLTTLLSFSLERRGEGNDWRQFVAGDDPNPKFPSGVVEKTYGYGLGLEWELRGNSSIGANFIQARVKNVAHQQDIDDWLTSVFMHVTWNL